MKKDNIIREKSFAFAVKIIEVTKYLMEERKEFVLSKQLLRAGTSIGANIEEAIGCQSERDFYSKISLSYKESRETIYWIRLLLATNYLQTKEHTNLLEEAQEISNILGAIQRTIKSKLHNS